MGEARNRISGSACAVASGGRDPERAVERAGEVGGEQAGQPQGAARASDLGQLQRRRVACPKLARQRRPRMPSRRSRRRRPARRRAARTAASSSRLRHGCSTSSSPDRRRSRRSARPPSSTSQAPLASIRIRARDPPPSRTAATRSTSAPVPTLTLRVVEAAPDQAPGVLGGDRRLVGARRSRCTRPARRPPAPSSAHAGSPAPGRRGRAGRHRPRPGRVALTPASRASRERIVAARAELRPDQAGGAGPLQVGEHGIERFAAPEAERDRVPPAGVGRRRRGAAGPSRGARGVPVEVTYGSRNGSATGNASSAVIFIAARSAARSRPAARRRRAAPRCRPGRRSATGRRRARAPRAAVGWPAAR